IRKSFVGKKGYHLIRDRNMPALLLCLVLGGAGLLSPAYSEQAETSREPVLIQRVLLPAAKLAAEVERVKHGVLVPPHREGLEERLKQAASAGETLKKPPRLVAAGYRAKLVDNALEGKAEWKILNPGSTSGILAVQPFNLALIRTWCDSRDAVLGELNGKDLGLLVERPGQTSVILDWSARSAPAPGGLRFNLETPVCAIA